MIRWIGMAIVLSLAACGPTPWGELSPGEASPQAPPDGVVVGVAVVARTPTAGWETANAMDVYLTFDQGGKSRELTLTRGRITPTFLLATYDVVENGFTMSYRPFAIKLKPGRGEFRAFENRRLESKSRRESRLVSTLYKDGNGNWQTKWETKDETVTDSYHVVSSAAVPPATFDVEPGKVVYIGRVGMLLNIDLPACPPRGSPPAASSHVVQCLVRETFFESQPDADLAMIRQRFPRLAGVAIEVQPLQTAPGSWQTFSEAARPYMAGKPSGQ